MQFHVEIGDKVRDVVVKRAGDRFTVTVDGHAYTVDARRLDAGTLSLLVASNPGANPVRSVEAGIGAGPEAGAFTVSVNGHGVALQLRSAGAGRRGRDAGGAAGAGPQKIKAPMPGKVVRVLVAPGDEVKARQGLVVVEAMKMENELNAARAGRVRDVLVSEGRSVDAGAVLVIVD
jgi:biotin carboxyl carrier protein